MHVKQLSIILVALIAVGSSSVFAQSTNDSTMAGSAMKTKSMSKKNAGMKSGEMQMKGAVKFKVRIENISSADGFTASDATKWPFAISPGAYAVHHGAGNPFFEVGKYVGKTGLEAQAEDGNPDTLVASVSHHSSVHESGVYNTPVGAMGPGPVGPGAAFEFEVTATPGSHLFLIFMFGQSNDLFFGNQNAIALFENGKPISGDITSQIGLCDAGTEVNEEPGIGPNQAPRQKAANTGASEHRVIGPVKDGYTYPNTTDVLRITVTPESGGMM